MSVEERQENDVLKPIQNTTTMFDLTVYDRSEEDAVIRSGGKPGRNAGTPFLPEEAPSLLDDTREERTTVDDKQGKEPPSCARDHGLTIHHPAVAIPETPRVICHSPEVGEAIAKTGYVAYSYCSVDSRNEGPANFGPLAGADLILIVPSSGAAGEREAYRIAVGLLSVTPPPVRLRITNRDGLPTDDFTTLCPESSSSLRQMLEGAAGDDWAEWSEEVDCPYKAGLRLAILDYEERSRRLTGSKKALVSSSNDADLSETLSQAWKAMSSLVDDQENPEIFQRNGDAVYLQEESRAGRNRLAIRRHTADSMRLGSAEAIFWYSRIITATVARGGGEVPLYGAALMPVIDAVQQLEARPHARICYSPPSDSEGTSQPERWEVVYPFARFPNATVTRSMATSLPKGLHLPALEAVVGIPLLSRDGTRMLTQRGYSREEGSYFDFDNLESGLTVEECIRRIDDLFGIYVEEPLDRPGFPFDTPASRAHLYACMLAGVIGPAVSKKPVFLFDKATSRTGATFMAETVSIILTGDYPTYVRAGTRNRASVDEMAKGLSAAVSSTKGVVLMDNVTGTLDDPEWNRYVTSEIWESRRLGRNDRTVRASRRNIVDMLTANNLWLTAESAARVCISRLDAAMEHPERRRFEWVPQERAMQDRPHYVAAVVGLVSHWLEEGGILERSVQGWGGFEEWRDLTAGILNAASVEGFGQAVGMESKDRLDDGGERAFVQWWW